MLQNRALRFFNHLLAGEAWARNRLKPFAGQCARIEFGRMSTAFVISSEGSLQAGALNSQACVSIRLPEDAVLRLLTDRQSLVSAARIEGSADFAEALGFISRNLRWDAEADLANLVGDVAAHRLVNGGRAIVLSVAEKARRLGANLAEYIQEEQRFLARQSEVDDFCAETDQLRDELARLEKRISRLR